MAFKTIYFSLWMLFILFAVVKGSCLEYGHSCWGAHGKRSGNNKIYRPDIKPPIEVDFQDLTGLKEKNNYDSNEEQLNGSSDSVSSVHDKNKASDEVIETPDMSVIKLKRFLYKKLNKSNGKQRNLEFPDHNVMKSNNILRNSERWRRLPFYNAPRVHATRPNTKWFKELEQEQQINEDYYI